MKNYLYTAAILIVVVFSFQFCNEVPNDNEELRKKIVDANNEIFNKRNFDFADEIFTDDYAGRGPQFIKDFAIGITDAFPDLEVKTEQIVVEGNHAGWYRTCTGTHENAYRGYPASGEKISWIEILVSEYDDKGLIAKEWYATNLKDKLHATNKVEGVYQYLPPLKGHGIIKNGNFIWLVGPSDGSAPMASQSGTYEVSDDIFKTTIVNSTEPTQIGLEFWSKTISWDGDTLTYETMNTNGEITGGGRPLRIAK